MPKVTFIEHNGKEHTVEAANGLTVMEAAMLSVHAVNHDLGLALVNLVLLALTVPVLLGRRRG